MCSQPERAPAPLQGITVHVVDDDATVRASLQPFLQRLGCTVCCHASAEEFLAGHDPAGSECLVLDVALPGMNGLELLQHLAARHSMLPTLVLSANADVESVVTAIQRGAVGFQQKPPHPQRLVEHVQAMAAKAGAMAAERADLARLAAALRTLTPREAQAFPLLARGMSTKQIALTLGISIRTAHIHRLHVFRNLRVENAVELVPLAARALAHGLGPTPA